ncbi:putative ribonuclease H-like domain-containing protein [Tanacetum coccineum]|uniref:Ribonuclease H-like domain-containing protein n=1 Tax=Tanacetum coccineum TaxID=301880 RepID=A0ABQ5AYI3_9ASTR
MGRWEMLEICWVKRCTREVVWPRNHGEEGGGFWRLNVFEYIIVAGLKEKYWEEAKNGNPEEDLKDYAIIDSGCSGRSVLSYLDQSLRIVDEDLVIRRAPELMMNKQSGSKKYNYLLEEIHWVFFLAYKDETYDMLHDLIVGLENKLRHKVKTIRCDHGTEFKNHLMNEFCAKKGIKREYSIARTPQQNGVAERKNRTLIEAARTMLADSLLPIQFWAEAVNTACYVLNRVLVTKPQMKTPYMKLDVRSPNISFMRPCWMSS